jgi:hypothetical protein
MFGIGFRESIIFKDLQFKKFNFTDTNLTSSQTRKQTIVPKLSIKLKDTLTIFP